MSDQDNITQFPLPRYMQCGGDPDELGETDEAYAFNRAEVREVLAGFLAVPIPDQAMGDGNSIEYELVETRVGIGVRTRLPNDEIDPDWGFLVCGKRPHVRYLELRQRFLDEDAWDIRDTVTAGARVLARAAQENARLAAVIAGVDNDVFQLLFS